MPFTFLVGGARSGKSSLAVEMGRRHDGPVTYVATAPITDDDMASRVARHRDERPATWSTIEEQLDLVGAIESVGTGLVVVDCLTLWTFNQMWNGHDETTLQPLAAEVAAVCATRPDPVVVISNEVGLGVHPETEEGREYRDVLGRVNQAVAARADRTLLLVAGRAVALGDPWDLLA